MQNEIVAFVQQQAKAAVGQAARPAALGLVAGMFFLFAVAALFSALFFWLEPLYGPPVAAVIIAAVALVLGLVATLPLMVGRRPEPVPAQASGATLPQVVSLLAQGASSLGPKQSALTAVVLAVALWLMARGSSRGKKQPAADRN
jgi:branched-subunit amino acid ABC-type transport system permease component